jgi:hypothetical protein
MSDRDRRRLVDTAEYDAGRQLDDARRLLRKWGAEPKRLDAARKHPIPPDAILPGPPPLTRWKAGDRIPIEYGLLQFGALFTATMFLNFGIIAISEGSALEAVTMTAGAIGATAVGLRQLRHSAAVRSLGTPPYKRWQLAGLGVFTVVLLLFAVGGVDPQVEKQAVEVRVVSAKQTSNSDTDVRYTWTAVEGRTRRGTLATDVDLDIGEHAFVRPDEVQPGTWRLAEVGALSMESAPWAILPALMFLFFFADELAFRRYREEVEGSVPPLLGAQQPGL